jgi:hypothetical protein
MATRSRRSDGGVAGAVRTDVQQLHGAWMALAFRRQRGRGHSVLSTWQPETRLEKAGYYAWSSPRCARFSASVPAYRPRARDPLLRGELDSTRIRFGVLGVTALAVVSWGALAAIAHVQLEFEPFLAVATGSTVLAAGCLAVGGRLTTTLFGMTALFLPPVVAALVTPSLEGAVLKPSYELAVWTLDTVLVVGGFNEYLRTNYDLKGTAYAAMWLAIAFPVGWFLGLVVALADLVRPSG